LNYFLWPFGIFDSHQFGLGRE